MDLSHLDYKKGEKMERHLEEIYSVFQDFHLAEGKPPLEFFERDEEFEKLTDKILGQYAGNQLVMCQLGDTFDFLSVANEKGKILAEPTKGAAIQKIKKIFAAHPKVIAAWKKFLSSGGVIKFFIGNHDLELFFPDVQAYIRYALGVAGWSEAANCVQFLEEEKKNGAYFIHGNNAEPVHSTPKKKFITSRLGRRLPEPILNRPYGNYSVTDLANKLLLGTRIFKGNSYSWVRKLEPHWYIFLLTICKCRNWWFGLCAFLMWFTLPFRHRFSRRWWVRENSGFIKLFLHNLEAMITVIFNRFSGRDFTYYARKILKENDDIDVIFIGHIHTFGRITDKNGTIIFSGNGSIIYIVDFPNPNLRWKYFRWLEKTVKILLAVKKIQPKEQELFTFGICKFLEGGAKEVDLLAYNYHEDRIEKVI